MSDDKPTVTCRVTQEVKETEPLADGSPGLPRGWTRLGGEYYSPKGWDQSFVPRRARLPVVSVVEGYDPEDWSQERCREGWKAFRKAMREAQRLCVQCANAMLFELAKLDTLPLEKDAKGQRKLPKLSVPANEARKILYRLGRDHFPEIDSQSMCSIRETVYRKYTGPLQGRFQVRILGNVSLATFRSLPVPFPEKDSPVWMNDSKQVFVRLRLGDARFTLRLRGGYKVKRHLDAIARLFADPPTAARGELQLYEQRAPSERNNGGSERRQPGANQVPTVVMCALTLYLPRQKGERTEGVMTVRTRPDKLYSVFLEDREQLWEYNADHLKRRVAAHANQLHRLSQDEKLERRRPRAERAQINGYREALVDTHHKLLADHCHKITRSLVNLARRFKVGSIFYDDRERGYLPVFPWFRLRTLVKEKADFHGIAVTFATAEEEPKDTAQPAAEGGAGGSQAENAGAATPTP